MLTEFEGVSDVGHTTIVYIWCCVHSNYVNLRVIRVCIFPYKVRLWLKKHPTGEPSEEPTDLPAAMSFSSFYSVVNAIKDKSAEAMNTLSSDLQDFKAIVQEDVAELSKSVREGRLSIDRSDGDSDQEEKDEDQDKDKDKDKDQEPKDPTQTDTEQEEDGEDPLTSLKNSLFSFDVSSTLGSLNSVGSSVQGSLTSVGSSVQGSLTSVGSKLTALNVGGGLGSLEAMGSKLLNSADEFLGTLAGDDAAYEEDEELSESELSARRFRLLALQEDSETYVDPPLDVETFEKWKATTPAEELAEIQQEVLENYPTVGAKFTELVPSVVEADVFWAHYVYKASLLAAQEQRGADLLEHGKASLIILWRWKEF